MLPSIHLTEVFCNAVLLNSVAHRLELLLSLVDLTTVRSLDHVDRTLRRLHTHAIHGGYFPAIYVVLIGEVRTRDQVPDSLAVTPPSSKSSPTEVVSHEGTEIVVRSHTDNSPHDSYMRPPGMDRLTRDPMIERIWHGWTTPEDADEYERLLREQILPSFADKDIDGYRGVRVLRRSHSEEIEFITIMRFRSIKSVKQFAGEDYETAHVPREAREVLARFDEHAQHYEVREQVDY